MQNQTKQTMEKQLVREQGCTWAEARSAVQQARNELGMFPNTLSDNEQSPSFLFDAARLRLNENQSSGNKAAGSNRVASVEAIPVSDFQAKKAGQPSTDQEAALVARAENYEAKKGAKCCGCCCDYRRAVIAMALVFVALESIVLIYSLSNAYMNATCGGDIDYPNYYDGYYYSEIIEECEEHFKTMRTVEITFSIVSILLCLLAVWGAVNFNVVAVGLNAVWMVLGYVLGLIIGSRVCNGWEDHDEDYVCTNFSTSIGSIVIGIVVATLFLYPHVGFIVEVKKGIMSAETYERERYSCCCTPPSPVGAQTGPTTVAQAGNNPPLPTAPTVATMPSTSPEVGSAAITETTIPDGSKSVNVETVNENGSKTIETTFEKSASRHWRRRGQSSNTSLA